MRSRIFWNLFRINEIENYLEPKFVNRHFWICTYTSGNSEENEKKLLIISALIWIPFFSYSQDDSNENLEAYFIAIIVSDFDSSISWYSDILGFEVVNRIESAERGFKQSNLKRGDVLIELIQLEKAVNLKDLV